MEKSNYKTDQKAILIDYLTRNSDKYVSVQEIEKVLFQTQKKIGLTTIYRFLNKLEKDGKLRVETREHTKYYQYISEECKNHFHLKCENCGKIIHFECEKFFKMINHIQQEHNFYIDPKWVIYGLCEECKNN